MADTLIRTRSVNDIPYKHGLANGNDAPTVDTKTLIPPLARANTTTHTTNGTVPSFTTQLPPSSPTEPAKPSSKHKRRWSLLPRARRTSIEARKESDSSDLDSSGSSSDDDEVPPLPLQSRREPTRVPFDNYPEHTNSALAPAPGRFHLEGDHVRTRGSVSRHDGRLKLSVNDKSERGLVARVLDAGIRHHLGGLKERDATVEGEGKRQSSAQTHESFTNPPRLNIVIMVIGSRGDIQPFIKIGKVLKEEYGHRVRLATHPAFKKFIEDECGLEFFSVGGDPAELMAFMVKNPGLIPSFETVKEGEIGRRRAAMAQMFEGFWKACVNTTDDEADVANQNFVGDREPFLADMIIANPPSFAHVHCAERLGCPLHIVFTFPYSPTTQFAHPLANIKKTNLDWDYTNFMSYALVDVMTWQGLGDLVNDFREKTLGLDPLSTLWAPGMLYRLHVSHTYLWSPGLVSKPKDWGPEIDIAGFVFLDLASDFKPPQDLVDFLEAGDAPIYIGFGSIVVDDPDTFTKMIYEAVKKAGVRALVNKGWGGFGSKDNSPDYIFMLDNTPHDWLFPRCKAVVHHGGAGTTAIGLKCAKPTMIVPFFGDQPFWGDMVSKAEAGAKECIPYKQLDADKFSEGIKQCLTEEAQANVQKIADSIASEGDGAANAVKSILSQLPTTGKSSLRCSIFADRVAVWQVKGTVIRLSALATELLVERRQLFYKQLKLLRRFEWNDFSGPGGPITGVGGAVVKNMAGFGKSIIDGPHAVTKDLKYYYLHEKKKRRHRRQTVSTSTTNPAPVTDPIHPAGPGKPTTPLPESTANTAQLESTLKEEASDPSAASARTAQQQNHSHTQRQTRASMPDRGTTQTSFMSADATYQQKLKDDVKQSLTKPASYVMTGPIDLLIALGLGFHNLPRVWQDNTVRRPLRIHNLRTGLAAARAELAWQWYDAVTGLLTHPVREVRKEAGARRILGGVQGVGKGLASAVVKPLAAVILPVPYIVRGAQRGWGKDRTPTKAMRRVRIAQGRGEVRGMGDVEKKERVGRVVEGWEYLRHAVPDEERAARDEEP